MKRDGLLDLNDALQHPGRHIAVDLSTDMPEEADIDLVAPVEGWLEAVSTGNNLIIEGEFRTKCIMDCARCGSPIEQAVEFKMEESFNVEGTPSVYAHDDFARVQDEDGDHLFHENSLIVENLLRQGLLLSLPIQPLCEYGWDGDCPNAQAVQKHFASESHSQLEELKDLKTDAEITP